MQTVSSAVITSVMQSGNKNLFFYNRNCETSESLRGSHEDSMNSLMIGSNDNYSKTFIIVPTKSSKGFKRKLNEYFQWFWLF
jgi:shikimate 5-dehydrogenase